MTYTRTFPAGSGSASAPTVTTLASAVYGFVGDGVADDTAALNAAYAAAVAAGGGILHIPPGKTVRTTGTGLLMNSNTRVVLDAYGVTFKPDQNATGITINPGVIGASVVGGAVQGLAINMTSTQTQTGIKLVSASRQALRDLNISGGAIGIHVNNDGGGYCEDNDFDNIYISSSATGIKFELTNAGTNSLEENTFKHVSVSGCTKGIWLGAGLEFRDVFMLSTKVWATNPGSQTCFYIDGDVTDWVADVHVENLAGAGNIGFHFTSTATNPDKATVRLGSVGTFGGGLVVVDTGTVGFIYQNQSSRKWAGKTGGYALRLARDTDTQDRVRFTATPGIETGPGGSTTPDTNLYRNAANQWKTDDQLVAADGLTTKTKAGTLADGDFTATPADGTIGVDTTTPALLYRAGGTWRAAGSGLAASDVPAPLADLLTPVIALGNPMPVSAGVVAAGAGRGYGLRFIVPRAGTLHDLAVWVGATTTGNIEVSVFSAAGTRARLATTGPVAAGTANAWQIVGDPALAVTAGQHIDIWVATSTNTVTLGKPAGLGISAAQQLPTGFLSGGAGLPKLVFGSATTMTPAPATLSEGSVDSTVGTGFLVIARLA